MGSACETEYHLLLAHDIDLLADNHYTPLSAQVCEVKQMLTVLTQKLRADG